MQVSAILTAGGVSEEETYQGGLNREDAMDGKAADSVNPAPGAEGAVDQSPGLALG
jgi:hypothetical protein